MIILIVGVIGSSVAFAINVSGRVAVLETTDITHESEINKKENISTIAVELNALKKDNIEDRKQLDRMEQKLDMIIKQLIENEK